ncbi:hypothetical protein J3R82DRAFT_3362 [Butyriboletus roseoflavus]|nr:hypothetical protein J3R82DRAFT_3362 [Butyriboletus roseoflavus]
MFSPLTYCRKSCATQQAGATQVPAMLIAAEVYWCKMKNEWPDWAKIAECEEEGIKHHPWYACITYKLFPFDSEEDAEPNECEDKESSALKLVKPEPCNKMIEMSGREAAGISIGTEDKDKEDAQEPQDNTTCCKELKTSKSSHSRRKHADCPRFPQPLNVNLHQVWGYLRALLRHCVRAML